LSLYDKLAPVVNVRPDSGWETQTNKGRTRYATNGIVLHWDAIKGEPSVSYYLEGNRYGAALYHIIIRRDGTVDLMSQGYVYHAGSGDSNVLADLRAGRVPRHPTVNNITGNGYLFSVSINYHPDEGDINATQYEAMVKTVAVLLKHFDLDPNHIIDHRGWTARKRDIDTMDLKAFRKNVALEGGDDMAILTDKEQLELRAFLKELEGVNSNVSFVRYLIPWYRKWRAFSPLRFLKRGDTL
jgi:hypothetical protein